MAPKGRVEFMLNYTISGFSDEIDKMVDVQFAHLNKLGIGWFEPRGIDGKNISDLDDADCAALAEKMKKYGIKVSSIGSPIGKIGIRDDFDAHMEKLARTIKIAKKLGARYIRVFSFYIPEGEEPETYRDEVMRRMKAMCALAEREDIVLLHENEKGIYGDIAPRCADILKTVNSERLRAVFEPSPTRSICSRPMSSICTSRTRSPTAALCLPVWARAGSAIF